MPKFFSVLTAVVALSAGVALVRAQESVPSDQKLAAAATTGERNADEISPEQSGTSEKPSGKPAAKSGTTAAPLPSSETAPTPTPKPHRRSFFSWLFGTHERKEATPAPAATGPTATPSPTPRKSVRRLPGTPAPEPKPGKATPAPLPTPTPKKTERPIHGPKPEKPLEATPNPEKVTSPPPVATPPARQTPKPKATPATGANESQPGIEAPTEADVEAKEKARFESAKAKAVDDPQIKSLKDKADQATTDDESRAALRAYNKALFTKIKKVDSGVSEYADQLEKSILKRLGE